MDKLTNDCFNAVFWMYLWITSIETDTKTLSSLVQHISWLEVEESLPVLGRNV